MFTVNPIFVAQVITFAILVFAEAIGSQMIRDWSTEERNPF